VGRLDPLVRPAGGTDDAVGGEQESHARTAEGMATSWQNHRLPLNLKGNYKNRCH